MANTLGGISEDEYIQFCKDRIAEAVAVLVSRGCTEDEAKSASWIALKRALSFGLGNTAMEM
tara:strand:- start:137 stop:322 length:186 start_codon:yes stop_codon:yes gene_type:complete